jgi:hypothetical protein
MRAWGPSTLITTPVCLAMAMDSFDILQVAIEIHSPLVQITRGHLQQPHLEQSRPSQTKQLKAVDSQTTSWSCLGVTEPSFDHLG